MLAVLQDRQASDAFSFSPATTVKRTERVWWARVSPCQSQTWTVETQRRDADLCQDTGNRTKACTLDRIGRRGSRFSGLSCRAHVARLYFRRRLGWSRISEPVSMAPKVISPFPCVAWFRGCGCGCGLSSPQGRSDSKPSWANFPRPARADKSRTRTCPPPPFHFHPGLSPARISSSIFQNELFLPSPLLG